MNDGSNLPVPGGGTVGKALDILTLVADQGHPLRFGEILDLAPYPKTTLYRLLQTLTSQGMLRHDPERQVYAPGLRLLRLAHTAWRQSSLAPLARAHLDALSARVGETIHLAQLDEGQVLYVDKRNAHRPLEMFSEAGKVGPGYCTGVGKAMMAHLPPQQRQEAIARQAFLVHTPQTLRDAAALRAELDTVRTAGVAFDREEHEPGIICIAVPILLGGDGGRMLGALSMTTSTRRNTLDGLAEHEQPLREAARNIAEAAESWQFPG